MGLFGLATALAILQLTTALPNIQHHDNDGGSWRSKIKNVVVLVEENRSFDTFCGGLTYSNKISGLLHHNFCNSINATGPNEKADVCAKAKYLNVHPDDPPHSISGGNMQLFTAWHPNEEDVKEGKLKANMRGFVTDQAFTYKTTNKTRAGEVLNYYMPDQIPVFGAMAENFVLFDHWFAAVPGPTNPNRAYLTSGTSGGHGRNDDAFNVYGLPQKSIFQQLSERGISWINYQNSTTGPGNGFNPDAAFYAWTLASGAATTNIKPLAQFYKDAAAGTLPAFTYLNPECCSYQSFHPPSPITLGEAFIKGIYEALRASPQWESTLFILTFDEHGGFGDHVAPPVDVPAGDALTYTERALDGEPITFDFTRLGVRVPTLVISPWVGRGVVEKRGRNYGGEYSHTSILAFVRELWGLESLTPRVAWSATFEHLIEDEMRTDTPLKLPNPAVFT